MTKYISLSPLNDFPIFAPLFLVAFTATKYYNKIHFYLNALNKHYEFMLKFY